MTDLQKRILNDIEKNQPTKAKQIAARLGKTRTEINHELYGKLKGFVSHTALFYWKFERNIPEETHVYVDPPVVKPSQLVERNCYNCIYHNVPDKCENPVKGNALSCASYRMKQEVPKDAYNALNEIRNAQGREQVPEKKMYHNPK